MTLHIGDRIKVSSEYGSKEWHGYKGWITDIVPHAVFGQKFYCTLDKFPQCKGVLGFYKGQLELDSIQLELAL